MDSAIIALLALATAIVTGIGTWIIARRRMSGTVSTTDADRLWAQNEKLLDAYKTDNDRLRVRLEAQDERINKQDEKLWVLTQSERECREQNATMRAQIGRLERMLKVDQPVAGNTTRVGLDDQRDFDMLDAIRGEIKTAAAALHEDVAAVHTEVKTINGATVAELLDATETRRIEEKRASEVTSKEDQHLEATKGMER